jgi:uncharacterized protein
MDLRKYFKDSVLQGLLTPPFRKANIWIPAVVVYSIIAMAIGFGLQLYEFKPLAIQKFWYLPVTLIIFPSFLEEFFFRGLLIPRDALDKGWKHAIGWIVASSLAFTLWHPLNALTINPSAQPFFLNVPFLIIVFCLGIVCGIGYVASRSLWTAVFIHWLTVVVWVFFLGGRNLVLES